MSEVLNQSQTTSSINAVWPPAPASNDRLRGFYTENVIRSPREVRRFIDAFRGYQEEVASSENTRLSIRLIASVGRVALLSQEGIRVEGALPFERDGEGLAVVYTGWNAPSRRVPEDMYDAYGRLLCQVVQRPRNDASPQELLERKGYTSRIVDPEMPANDMARLAEDFTDLYVAFGYDYADVVAMLGNPANTIGYIERDGQIVSTSMAEAGAVNVGDIGPVHIVEMTEAFTRLQERGQGLYRDISRTVLNGLMQERQEGRRAIDVLYGESNLAMLGVLNAAHENGRQFNHFAADRFGIDGRTFGILPQNVKVDDGIETRQYNDFTLSHIPLDEEAA